MLFLLDKAHTLDECLSSVEIHSLVLRHQILTRPSPPQLAT